MQTLNLDSNADKFFLVCLTSLCTYVLLLNCDELIKNSLVVFFVSKLYRIDEKINRKNDQYFEMTFSEFLPIKKIVCLIIILQKKVCHMLLLYFLFTESILNVFTFQFWIEKLQILSIISNCFASHICLQGFMEGKTWTPFILPILSLIWNAYLVTQNNFFTQYLLPSLILLIVFIITYLLTVNFINVERVFRTRFIENIAEHVEQLGSFQLAVQFLQLFNNFQQNQPLKELAGPCMTVIFVNFTVKVFHYPEQFFIRSLAQSYNQNDCAICLCDLHYKPIQNITLTSCFHFFHQQCLDDWIDTKKNSCPVCRQCIEDEEDDGYQQPLENSQFVHLLD